MSMNRFRRNEKKKRYFFYHNTTVVMVRYLKIAQSTTTLVDKDKELSKQLIETRKIHTVRLKIVNFIENNKN